MSIVNLQPLFIRTSSEVLEVIPITSTSELTAADTPSNESSKIKHSFFFNLNLLTVLLNISGFGLPLFTSSPQIILSKSLYIFNLIYKYKFKQIRLIEWIKTNPNGEITVGITDNAQQKLGDLVFVELPEVGAEFEAQGECVVVESVKAASDVYSPLSGEVTEINEALNDNPEIINTSPYDDGWFFKIKPQDISEMEKLLDAGAYESSSES